MSNWKAIRNIMSLIIALAIVVVGALAAYNHMNPTNPAPAAPAVEPTMAPTAAPVATATPVVVAATQAPALAATTIPVEQTAEYLALRASYEALLAEQAAAQATATPVVVVATPAPVATAAPAATTQAPVAPVAQKTIRSSELVLVGYTADNQPFTHAIREADLKKVNYVDVQVEEWDGLTLVRNSAGLIVRLYGREDQGSGREAKQAVTLKKAQSFFNSKGHLRADNAREGWWNGKGSALAKMDLRDVRIVQIQGESFYRLVVAGQAKKASKSTPVPDDDDDTVVDEEPAPSPAPSKAPAHNDDDDNVVTEEPVVTPTPSPAPSKAPAHNGDDTVVTKEPVATATPAPSKAPQKPSHSDDDKVVKNENGDEASDEKLPSKQPAHTEDQASDEKLPSKQPAHSDDQGGSSNAAHSDDDTVVRNENGDAKADEAGLPKK